MPRLKVTRAIAAGTLLAATAALSSCATAGPSGATIACPNGATFHTTASHLTVTTPHERFDLDGVSLDGDDWAMVSNLLQPACTNPTPDGTLTAMVDVLNQANTELNIGLDFTLVDRTTGASLIDAPEVAL